MHGNAWPDLFLSKMKGVLDKLGTDREAFSTFITCEMYSVFKDTRALVVPYKLKPMVAISDLT